MNDMKKATDRATKKGISALTLALILLAALIAVNCLLALLPADKKVIDLTSDRIFSVSDATKREVAKTPVSVKVYLLSTNGEAGLSEEGVHLHTFLGNLAAVSNKISYTLVNPSEDTSILERYEFSSQLANLSVIVESGLRSYHIPYSDFFSYYVDGVGKVSESNAMYYYYYYGVTPYYCFDGEALMLAALHYTTSTNVPTAYVLTGHSEPDITSTAATMLSTVAMNVKTLSLTSGAPVPANCDLVIVNAPQTDISASEAALLLAYVQKGGSIFLTTTPDIVTMPNLASLAAAFGLAPVSGIVAEENSQYYYSADYPYYLLPAPVSHALTDGLSSVSLPFSHAIGIANASAASISPILTTSDSAYLIPLDSETATKPEDAVNGTYCLGAVAEASNGATLIWIPCTNFLSDTADSMASGGNSMLFSSCISYTCGSAEAAPTASVLPLVTETMTVEVGTARIISLILTILLPAALVGFGILHTIRRKRK